MKLKKFIGILMASIMSMSSLSLYAMPISEMKTLENNLQKGEMNKNESYTVVQYNSGSLQDAISKVSVAFPVRLKIEGNKMLTKQDFDYLRDNAKELDLTEAKVENNIFPEEAFAYSPSLMQIKLPKNLTVIGPNAFVGCQYLESISLPETLIEIKESAFAFCLNLKDVLLPESFKVIDDMTFLHCTNISSMILPRNLEKIGSLAFGGCEKLNFIVLPKNLKEIDDFIFHNKIVVKENPNLVVGVFEDSLGETKMLLEDLKTLPALDIVKVDDISLKIPMGANIEKTLTLKTKIYDNNGNVYDVPVTLNPTKINTQQVGLMTLRENVLIKEYAINPIKVNIQVEIVPTVDQKTNLKEIVSAYQLIEIGEPFNLPLGIEAILDNGEKTILPVKWDNSDIDTTKEGQYTLKGEVLLYEGLTNSKQIEATLNVTVQDSSKVHKSAAEDFKIDENGKLVAYLGNSKYVEIPEGVITIGEKAFRNQHQLEKVVLPSTLKNIEREAFRNATQLKEVVFNKGLESIGNGAFLECRSLQKIELPTSLKALGVSAFASCSALTSVDLGGSLKTIQSSTFSHCKSLKEVKGSDQLDKIDSNAFKLCENLKKINLLNVSSIGKSAFLFAGIETLQLDKLTHLEESAFALNKALKTIDFGESPLMVIPKYAFTETPLLSELSFPKTLKEIKDQAFLILEQSRTLNEEKLVLNFPHTLEKVGKQAFYSNINIDTVRINSECVLFYDSFSQIENLVLNELVQFDPEEPFNAVEELGFLAAKIRPSISNLIVNKNLDISSLDISPKSVQLN